MDGDFVGVDKVYNVLKLKNLFCDYLLFIVYGKES